MRLVDAERMDVFAAKCPDGRDVYSFMDGVTAVFDEMDKLPIINLVRCGECKFSIPTNSDEDGYECEFHNQFYDDGKHMLWMSGDFCSNGIRKSCDEKMDGEMREE